MARQELNPKTLETEQRVAETSVSVETPNGPLKVNPAPTQTLVAVSGGNDLTFEMYCSIRGIPWLHQAGMRAFTKLTKGTLRDWDLAFRKY